MMIRAILASAAALALAACSAGGDETTAENGAENGEVNLYSSRHYDTDLALYEDFTKATGIKVNRIEAKADALIERVVSEGEFSPADLLITVDAGRLWRAEEAGILQALDSEVLTERLPAHLRHPDGLWFGLSTRARIVIYNKEAGTPPIANYADLASPAYRGKICMRPSSNIYNISLLSSIVAHEGAAKAEEWTKGVVANFARDPQGNDTANIEAVAAGECGISIVNSYYLARYTAEGAENPEIMDKIGIIFPNQNSTGAHVNISGAGLLKHSPNRENAIKFLEYLTEKQAQEYFANGNNEYPAAKDVKAGSAVEALGTFKPDTINASELGKNQKEAVQIFDRAGWN